MTLYMHLNVNFGLFWKDTQDWEVWTLDLLCCNTRKQERQDLPYELLYSCRWRNVQFQVLKEFHWLLSNVTMKQNFNHLQKTQRMFSTLWVSVFWLFRFSQFLVINPQLFFPRKTFGMKLCIFHNKICYLLLDSMPQTYFRLWWFIWFIC